MDAPDIRQTECPGFKKAGKSAKYADGSLQIKARIFLIQKTAFICCAIVYCEEQNIKMI